MIFRSTSRLASATRSLLPSTTSLSTTVFTQVDFLSLNHRQVPLTSARNFFTDSGKKETEQTEAPKPVAEETKPETPADENEALVDEPQQAETVGEEASLSLEHQQALDDIEALSKELEAARAEAKDMKGKLLLSYADMENVRTRARKDVDLAGQQAVQKMAKDLLRVADTLGIATKAGSEAMQQLSEEDQGKLQSFEEGIINTEKLLLSAFEGQGITQFASVGEKFDPNLHEGLFVYDDPSKEPGTIGQVMREGYMIKDYVLRAAQVGTIKKRD